MLNEGMALVAPATEQARATALIGPNAVLQIVAALERHLGKDEAQRLCVQSGNARLPSGHEMIPEEDAIRLHRTLAGLGAARAEQIARAAGYGTADYIIANRIPRFAVSILQWLPASLAAPLLMAAIKRHAWTFVGAGHFEPKTAWSFLIERSEFTRSGREFHTLSTWYAAVFERLYRRLVGSKCICHLSQPRTNSPEPLHFRIARRELTS